MKYRMIISDYDGTLAPAYGKVVQKETIEAIKAYREAGGYFVLCSGRGAASAFDAMEYNNINCDAISAFQGATIKIGDTITEDGLDGTTVREIVEFVRNIENRDFVTFNNEVLLYDGNGEALNYYVNWSTSYKNKAAVNIPEYTLSHGGYYGKLLLTKMPDENTDRIVNAIKEKFGDKIVINSGSEILIEMVSATCTKYSACKKIAEHFNVNENEVITVGDTTNDLTLVAFGEGCAVESGTPELKKAAKHIVPAADKQPIKYLIDKILSGEDPFDFESK